MSGANERGLESSVVVEVRQDAWKALSKHRLSRTRRPDEKQVVTATRSKFEPETRSRLPANFCEIHCRALIWDVVARRVVPIGVWPSHSLSQTFHDLGQGLRREDLCRVNDTSFGLIGDRDDDAQ